MAWNSASCMVAAMLWVLVGCAASPPPKAAGVPDEVTEARVKAVLAADPGLSGRVIEVSVKDGVVHLRGFVESTYDLLLAQGDVKSVPGVVAVDEQSLAIMHGGSPP